MIKDYIEIIKYYALSNISLSYKLIGKVVKIELIKSCPSIILIVSTEIEKYVIKFYTSTANLDLLHNYSIHISNSMRAQTIIVNDFGELYSKVNILDNNYYMVIRNYIRGNKPSFLDLEDVFCFGESLGILHSISDNFSFNLSSSINKKERLDIYIDNIIDLVKNNNSYKLNFGSYLDNLHESISMLSSVFCDNTLLAADTLIHGDISSDNSIMLGNSVCFIDFDDFCYSSKYYDIGAFKWEISYNGEMHEDTWQVFLSGYSSTFKGLENLDMSVIDYCIIHKELEVITYYLELIEYYGSSYTNTDFINNRIIFLRNHLNKYMEY
ncbi:phosphotransferase [uncultured Psychrobacter sp.]|jgi:Ser/Thr protein kinase RdoA (MazF antagonist)|uniref:phosphotransferase n=1 Tax=uncultured Psychrobacter sp. TaxID=259303 RepID=UPI002613318D|nr:phosphotransferase [uncultured Psychrobacter sp.]